MTEDTDTKVPEAEEAPPAAAPTEAQASASESADAPASGAAPPAEAAAEPAPPEGSEPTEARSAVAEAPASSEANAAEATSGEAPGELAPAPEGQAGEGAAAGAEGEGAPKKKRRRRRRRKKGGAGAEGGEGAEAAAEGSDAAAAAQGGSPKKKEGAAPPFQNYIESKKHAFSVGEAVAGRVVSAEDGRIIVDLFGKALAYARLNEPRDIPLDLGPPDADANEGAEAEADGSETPSEAEAAPAETPAAEGAGAEPSGEAAAETAAAESTGEADETAIAAAADEPTPGEPTVAETATELVAAELASEPAAAERAASAPEAIPAEASIADAPEPPSVAEPAAAAASDAAPPDASASDAAEPDAAEPDAAASSEAESASEPAAEPGVQEKPAEPPPLPAYVREPEGQEPATVNTIFRGRVACVAESGHIALVNERIDFRATRAYLAHAKESRARVDGLVFGFNRGGFDVLVFGLRAFCPVAGLSLGHVEDPSELLGQWAEFHVQQAKRGPQGLVVSRRSIMEKEARKRARQLLKSLTAGQELEGRVTQVRDFGAFVDIGGIEGLVHQSELSWERNARPADIVKPGDTVKVKVLGVQEAQNKRETDRISLSLKAMSPDPWDEHAEQIAEGTAREAEVVRTTEFGAFIQLAPGIDGLLHITELGRDLKHADQATSVGAKIPVVIERVDRKARRISLSKLSEEEARLLQDGQLEGGTKVVRSKPGSHVTVKVTQVVPAGIQVQVEGVIGKRGRGFIPNVEMGTARGTDHRRDYPPGHQLEVKVIGTDRDGGLRLSRKGYLQDEERRAIRDYRKEASKQGLGTFGDLLRSKLGLDESSS